MNLKPFTIALAQSNFVLGDLHANAQIILTQAKAAYTKGAKLLVSPELSLTGYPPEDLLLRDAFIHAIESELALLTKELAQFTDFTVIVGHPSRNQSSGQLFNQASVLRNGLVVHSYAKQKLPNSEVFDEVRYFQPGNTPCVFDIDGLRIGLPKGGQPSTHILKPAIATVEDSVVNECFCMALSQAMSMPTAPARIFSVEGRKVLLVTRYDRRISSDSGIEGQALRIHQEDFCQALGMPSHLKYEADGGPGLRQLSALLRTSANATDDLRTMFEAQLFFWMLAATDGHAKNFSLSLLAGGAYQLTPLYDILSAWPIAGTGVQEVPPAKLRMAMALRGKSPHYFVKSIQPRHFLETAQREGYTGMADSMYRMGTRALGALQKVAQRLPDDFPQALFDKVAEGMLDMARRLSTGG